MKLLKGAGYTTYKIVKPCQICKISMHTSLYSFLEIMRNKRPGTSLLAAFFVEFFDENSSFVKLYKLTIFH